jgi:hypothetical protein
VNIRTGRRSDTEGLRGVIGIAVGSLEDRPVPLEALLALAKADGEENDDPVADFQLL